MTEKQALKLGRRIVRYTLASRKSETFPLTAGWIQRVSRRIGEPVGRDRAYRVQHALRRAGEITDAGAYAHRRRGEFTGFKVRLWRATARLRQRSFSVPDRGRQGERTRLLTWGHSLFGDITGRPPPGLSKAKRRRMRSADAAMSYWEALRCQ